MSCVLSLIWFAPTSVSPRGAWLAIFLPSYFMYFWFYLLFFAGLLSPYIYIYILHISYRRATTNTMRCENLKCDYHYISESQATARHAYAQTLNGETKISPIMRWSSWTWTWCLWYTTTHSPSGSSSFASPSCCCYSA